MGEEKGKERGMKLIIDIDENDYKWIKNHVNTINEQRIANGIPIKDEVIIATLLSLATDKDYKPELADDSELLEQEPCEDAISRAKAMTEIMMSTNIREHLDGNLYIKVADAVQILRDLPSVKPPTGHWIIMGDRYIKCSECGHITKTESPDIYHFCMVCGAKMSEEPEYEVEILTNGNCMICGKELDEGLFFCKECGAKAESEG